jgi:fumarate hydratase class II/aspartate ammonia-lyase
MKTRTERDSLGTLEVPEAAYWGAQTQRAVENFPISGLRPFPAFVRATVRIKLAAARVNAQAGALDPELAKAIEQAAEEILEGKLADQFVVDVFQAGAGTSHHMNVKEVLAHRANELLGRPREGKGSVHPNDHVNLGQSTNDVIPTAIRLAGLELSRELLAVTRAAAETLARKAKGFAEVVKSGRTHLQDAAPMTLGQEVGAWGSALERHLRLIEAARRELLEVGIGGSAVGTGLNTPPGYREGMAEALGKLTGEPLTPAGDYFEAMQSLAPAAALSGAVRNLALELGRICNDLRLLASGPNTGLGELVLPAVQPGSSIMPGKVNPSIAEMVNQVCFMVLGYDHTVAAASGAGQLELNVMMPVIAYALCAELLYLPEAVRTLNGRCREGLEADVRRCLAYAEKSPQLVTALAPRLGYAKAAEVAKHAVAEGVTIKEWVVREKLLTREEADGLLDPSRLTRPVRLD